MRKLLLLVLVPFATHAQGDAAAFAAAAAALEGTIFVQPHRESADGKLSACGLEFAALKRDFSTMHGAPVKVSGSFYLRGHPQGGLGYSLKLGLFDGLGAAERPSAPANAFMRSRLGNPPQGKAVRVDSDSPGYALFVGAVDGSVAAIFGSVLEKRELVVGFNRRLGQQDVQVLLDLTVVQTAMHGEKAVRTRSNDPVDEFSACTRDLVKDK